MNDYPLAMVGEETKGGLGSSVSMLPDGVECCICCSSIICILLFESLAVPAYSNTVVQWHWLKETMSAMPPQHIPTYTYVCMYIRTCVLMHSWYCIVGIHNLCLNSSGRLLVVCVWCEECVCGMCEVRVGVSDTFVQAELIHRSLYTAE